MDEPITVAPGGDSGDDIEPILPDESLPEEPKEDTTADNAEEQTEDTGDEESLPEVDDKLKSFAKGQGIEDVADLSPREMSLLKSAYDNKAQFERDRQKASGLEKSLIAAPAGTQGDNPDLVARVERMEMNQSVNAFFATNPEARELEGKMAEVVTTRPDIGQLVKAGYLSMDDLYNLARGGDSSRDAQLKTEGGREALKKVASKQQAKAVTGNATTSALADNQPEDAFLKAFEAES